MKKILCTGSSGIVHVVRQLQGYDLYTFHRQERDIYNSIDINVENILPIADGSIYSRIMKDSADYCVSLYNDIKNMDVSKLYPDVQSFVKNQLCGAVYSRIPEIIAIVYALDVLHPDIILAQDFIQPLYHATALWGAENNVPCIHIPHSVYIDMPYERTDVGTDIHDLITESHVVVASDYQKQWFLDRGMPEENIFITGTVKSDLLLRDYNPSAITAENAKTMLGVSGKPVVTYLATWSQKTNILGFHDSVDSIYLSFLKATKMLAGVNFIVKLHPNSSPQLKDWHAKMAKDIGAEIIITDKYLGTIAMASDLVISYGASNAIIDAAVYGTRLMVTHGYEDDDVVTKIGIDVTPDNFAKKIAASLNSSIKDASEFINKYYGVVDGHVAERIAKVVEEIVNA